MYITKPTIFEPGTAEKVEVMRRRFAAGYKIFHQHDAPLQSQEPPNFEYSIEPTDPWLIEQNEMAKGIIEDWIYDARDERNRAKREKKKSPSRLDSPQEEIAEGTTKEIPGETSSCID